MKQSKKFIGLLLLGIMAIMMTAAVHAAEPEVADEILVNLYQETGDECDVWKVDCATSVIPIKGLKWNAKVYNFKSSTVKVYDFCRRTGTYYINFKANQYIRPGHTANVRFVIEQDGEVYVLKTKLIFQVRETPFKEFRVGSKDYAPDFTGVNKVAATTKSGVAVVTASVKGGYKYVKLVYTNKKGYAHTFAKGNKLKLSNLKKIECVYTTKASYAAAKWLGYYKAENCSYNCKKLFPCRHVATLTF